MRDLFETLQGVTEGTIDPFKIEVADGMERYKEVLEKAGISFSDKVESVDESQVNFLVFETEADMVKAQALMQEADRKLKEDEEAGVDVNVKFDKEASEFLQTGMTEEQVKFAANSIVEKIKATVVGGKSELAVTKEDLVEKKDKDAKAKAKKEKEKKAKEAKARKDKIAKLEARLKKVKELYKKNEDNTMSYPELVDAFDEKGYILTFADWEKADNVYYGWVAYPKKYGRDFSKAQADGKVEYITKPEYAGPDYLEAQEEMGYAPGTAMKKEDAEEQFEDESPRVQQIVLKNAGRIYGVFGLERKNEARNTTISGKYEVHKMNLDPDDPADDKNVAGASRMAQEDIDGLVGTGKIKVNAADTKFVGMGTGRSKDYAIYNISITGSDEDIEEILKHEYKLLFEPTDESKTNKEKRVSGRQA